MHFNSIALLHPSLDGCNVHTPLLEPAHVEGCADLHGEREYDRGVLLCRDGAEGLQQVWVVDNCQCYPHSVPGGIGAAAPRGTGRWCRQPPSVQCWTSARPPPRSPCHQYHLYPLSSMPHHHLSSCFSGGLCLGGHGALEVLGQPHVLDLHPVHVHAPGVGGLLL